MRYLRRAAASGMAWSMLAMVLDGVTEADHSWAIPWNDPVAFAAVIVSGAFVGVTLAVVFENQFQRPSRYNVLLPLLTLPTAIGLFAILVWACRTALGYRLAPWMSPGGELRMILETYLVYGVFSVAMPILYGLALLNQRAMKLPVRGSDAA